MDKIGKFIKIDEKNRSQRLIRILAALSFRAYLRAFQIDTEDKFEGGWYWVRKGSLKAARDLATSHLCNLDPLPRNIIIDGVEKAYRLISGGVDINTFWKFYVAQAWIRNIYGEAVEKIMREHKVEDALLHVKPDLTPLLLSKDPLPKDMLQTRAFPEELTNIVEMKVERAKRAVEIVINKINSFSVALQAIYALYIYSWGVFFAESEDIITIPAVNHRFTSYALKDPEELWALLEKPVIKNCQLTWSSQKKQSGPAGI